LVIGRGEHHAETAGIKSLATVRLTRAARGAGTHLVGVGGQGGHHADTGIDGVDSSLRLLLLFAKGNTAYGDSAYILTLMRILCNIELGVTFCV